MADGGRNGPVQTARRQDQGGAEVQDHHSPDGVDGRAPGRKAVAQDPGRPADGVGGGEILHGLSGRTGDDPPR
ncbi:MAG: hypothetical protein ACK56I_21910, partial [bacterium]